MTDTVQDLREQLLQLKNQHAAGTLDARRYAKRRAALERRLAALMSPGDRTAAQSPRPATPATPAAPAAGRPGARLWAGIAVLVVLVAAAGYRWTAAPAVIGQPPAGFTGADAPAASPAAPPHAMDDGQMIAMTDRLAERLKSQPGDAAGWTMLGRSYMALGRFPEALAAHEQALKLQPNDASTLADYADALAVQNDRNLAGEPTRLIEQALKLDPDHLKALGLAGTAAFNRKDYAQAVKHWDRAVQVGAADNPMVQQARSAAAEARQLGKLPPAAAAAVAPPAAAAAPATPGAAASKVAPAVPAGVSGTVTLAPALAAKAQPDDTVFIFARPAEGSRMPLAIVRKQVRDLPIAYRLDDSVAMSPAALLSAAGRVVVGARVSKSGQAMPQPGDLEGLSAPVSVGAAGVDIAIAGTVK
jgi:cytochrome c-type biogenesis protein CcmH